MDGRYWCYSSADSPDAISLIESIPHSGQFFSVTVPQIEFFQPKLGRVFVCLEEALMVCITRTRSSQQHCCGIRVKRYYPTAANVGCTR